MNLALFWKTISSLSFWARQIARFASLGPVVPIFLAMLESFVPPLPMVGIVALSVAAHGAFFGTLYCWIGTCIGCTLTFLFFRKPFKYLFARYFQNQKWYQKADGWVDGVGVPALFLIIMMPFTPSAFVNFAFGISDFPVRRYLPTLYLAKIVMISLLAVLGQSAVDAARDPRLLIVVLALFVFLYWISKKVSRRHRLS